MILYHKPSFQNATRLTSDVCGGLSSVVGFEPFLLYSEVFYLYIIAIIILNMGNKPLDVVVKQYWTNKLEGNIRSYHKGNRTESYLRGCLKRLVDNIETKSINDAIKEAEEKIAIIWEHQRGHSSLLVSDYIINEYGFKFTPFHLNRLVFISHGRTLSALSGRPLIRDRIEAWKYGPVIPVLYYEHKIWGDKPIFELCYCGAIPGADNDADNSRNIFFELALNKKERYIINDVVKEYDGWSFDDLHHLCCEPGTPWDKHYDGEFGTEIPDSTIKKYYDDEMVMD